MSLDFEALRFTWRQVDDGLGERDLNVDERCAIRQPPISCAANFVHAVLWREALRMMEHNLTQFRIDRERDGNEVIEDGLELSLAKLTAVAIVDTLKASKTLNNTGALRAEEQPVYSEESARCRVEKEINGLPLGNVLVTREGDRID